MRSRTTSAGKLAGALLISVACATAQAAITVQMQVNDSETKLEITTRGTCTSGANPNGCVRAQGTQPINFVLVGEKRCPTGITDRQVEIVHQHGRPHV